MICFKKVSKYADIDLSMPTRATSGSAGYDLYAAEDVVIPPIEFLTTKIREECFKNRLKPNDYYGFLNPLTLDEIAEITKETKSKVTLVSTGMKCYLPKDHYLELSIRSSTSLRYWLILGNQIGVVDSDYADNPENEGEIFLQLINLSPIAIQIKRGDKIAQGIIKRYLITDDDCAEGERSGGFGSTT